MANLSLLITCLALFSLVSNFCFGLNPNDWGPGSGSDSPPSMGSGPGGPGSPPDYGSGSPPSMGSGPGGPWSPPVYGSGSPPSGPGSPPGYGSEPGSPGFGSGSGSAPPGYGSEPGSPDFGSGSGSAPPGYGSEPGSPGFGSGSGLAPPDYGSPPGYGSGSPPSGSGSGSPPGYGSGSPPGTGSEAGWTNDRATFYGDPTGSGNENGGACGYKGLSKPPYSSMVSSGNAAIYQNGAGCGKCYQVKCSGDHCSGQPVTVTITDSSLDIYDHKFDLSGFAFGQMAIQGEEDQLRSRGIVDIQYKQVDCNSNSGANVAYGVNASSNPN